MHVNLILLLCQQLFNMKFDSIFIRIKDERNSDNGDI